MQNGKNDPLLLTLPHLLYHATIKTERHYATFGQHFLKIFLGTLKNARKTLAYSKLILIKNVKNKFKC